MQPSQKIPQTPIAEPPETDLRTIRLALQDIISDTDEDLISSLMGMLSDMDFEVVTPPALGLIMMNVKDSTDTIFHLGEVLVTQASVNWKDTIGHGCVVGHREDAAMVLACLDALTRSELYEPNDDLFIAIKRIHRKVLGRRQNDARITATTRVDFRSMAEE